MLLLQLHGTSHAPTAKGRLRRRRGTTAPGRRRRLDSAPPELAVLPLRLRASDPRRAQGHHFGEPPGEIENKSDSLPSSDLCFDGK